MNTAARPSSAFRHLLEAHADNISTPAGLTGDMLVALAHVLEQRGQILPNDYAHFLRETNGFVWNGVQIFGSPASSSLSPYDLVNCRSLLDLAPHIAPDRLLVGVDEVSLYAHDPASDRYERYDRANGQLDERTYDTLFQLLTDIFSQRQGMQRRSAPVISTMVN